MTSVCLSRLKKEYIDIKKRPLENIRASPKESNLLEWHYVIEGPKGSPYEGGFYHGMVVFPREYPHKPPSLQMFTPNGRFKPHTRLCLSISDFHPESWNPLWSVGTILLGLYTFMLDEQPTYGSIVTSTQTKRQFAAESLEYNVTNKTFCELFPELVELQEERKKNAPILAPNAVTCDEKSAPPIQQASWATILGILAAVIAFTWAVLSLTI
jgi:ubiquitin-conjugating enzyme E2 J2